ncbi:hypothetical protein J2Z31_002623 [Sinorhizobium kostiense]|uniref:Uncharacterized protein n=1 Tax=Sinorhizobium kostiense TaxID=76747 RepID=A0ABS4QZP6_9HYPH|nr:hypothetical protein [Sinorhizobium kostiense]
MGQPAGLKEEFLADPVVRVRSRAGHMALLNDAWLSDFQIGLLEPLSDVPQFQLSNEFNLSDEVEGKARRSASTAMSQAMLSSTGIDVR